MIWKHVIKIPINKYKYETTTWFFLFSTFPSHCIIKKGGFIMIKRKHQLLHLQSAIYENLHLPLLLLDKDLQVIHLTPMFQYIRQDYFQSMIKKEDILQYKIYAYHDLQENYFFFQYSLENISYICLGPFFNPKTTSLNHPILQHIADQIQNYNDLPYISSQSLEYITFIYQMITGMSIEVRELELHDFPFLQSLKNKQILEDELIQMRKTSYHQSNYEYEQKILEYIKNNDSTKAHILMKELLQIKGGRYLDFEQIQSMKDKLLYAVVILMKGIIDADILISKAYALGDFYTVQIEEATSKQELYEMLTPMINDFASLFKKYQYVQTLPWIEKCKDYISHHLHDDITLEDIGDFLHMNPCYVSTHFKKVTKISLKQYIHDKKTREAMFLINNSDYSLSEITKILKFSNQSHFHKIFRANTGITPLQYKNKEGTLKR